MQVLNVRAMGVALYHEKFRQNPALFGEIKLPDDDVRRLGAQLEQALAQREGCLLLNDLAADQAFAWLGRAASVRQFLAVPLKRQDQIVGSLFALQKKTGDFNSVDSKLLTSIANESAIYLENAVLYGDVHELMMGLLHSLVSAVDAKDAYTCGHSERVALLSRDLAGRVGLPDTQVERVYMSGLLHDVGKIGVPEAVLQKTGKLTPEEFEEIKKHPAIGAKILADVRQLEDVIPGVLYHHERYDGRGYPAGLAGRDIPLMGRLICLADCFDAMTSSRTYRKAMPVEVALTEIRRCSGTQFDPELADAFLQSDPQQIALLLKDHQHQAKRLLELPDSRRAA
jgi:HD-GYP domain-containing protein (c-di-GMP phosphodiesterase class II)